MEPLVSIIVPIYKVEKYIRRCVESILNQSYKNIEIILVDDGSPDNCGRIIETYEDSRIIVLHKDNGGLSDARNYGMKYITGEYTLFVDSDDWIDLSMVETLVDIAEEYKAQVVQVGFYYAYKGYLLYDDRYYKESDDLVLLNNKELMKELVINERIKNFAWGKLYRTDIIKDIPFKKGVLFEDIFWAHLVMEKVNKYVICHKPLCYYLQRSNSIVAVYSVRNLDMVRGLEERHRYIKENYKELVNESYRNLFNGITTQYDLLNKNKEFDENYKYRRMLRNSIKNRYDEFEKALKDDKNLYKRLKAFRKSDFIYKGYMLWYRVTLRLTHKYSQHLKRINV
ncbi:MULTISPECIES: glycosyltransferase family 2 protein [unclassified Clostridium]|uniref:glycosyltransferase family 2 protein n=1 Tax=unclassified Clostridium TaxID=2614128 RepID=UPI003217386C